ncbi:type IV pilus modification PilV family protein [Marinobacterium arenosum]|uniref:type IV pilus modification PilV family protein n=1 Tax=Marinobacterium arenosum TaxID=2862496 RepID=UPI001C95C148|nr:prepilin-type N-terminal cleavage/methylation domain-containing protein [Marinobacterium arenosum]MBY4678552.1 prepilin-type N-terminal cleavage/methylation domain-containing protein [Marinobacterium arenosum]
MRTERSRGFTLLEVLVAFLVLAVSLGVLMRLFSQSSDLSRASQNHQQALQLAQSKMAELVSLPELSPQRDSGQFEIEGRAQVFDWLVEVKSWEFPDEEVGIDYPVVPYLVRITVEWGDSGAEQLSLTTLRLINEESL